MNPNFYLSKCYQKDKEDISFAKMSYPNYLSYEATKLIL